MPSSYTKPDMGKNKFYIHYLRVTFALPVETLSDLDMNFGEDQQCEPTDQCDGCESSMNKSRHR